MSSEPEQPDTPPDASGANSSEGEEGATEAASSEAPTGPSASGGGEATGAASAEASDAEAPSTVERLEKRALHEVVHLWIPLAIVLVSVCAAIVGWRASLADESATHLEELSRQDLVQQQQLLIQDNDSVDTDIRTFGQFAQNSHLAPPL